MCGGIPHTWDHSPILLITSALPLACCLPQSDNNLRQIFSFVSLQKWDKYKSYAENKALEVVFCFGNSTAKRSKHAQCGKYAGSLTSRLLESVAAGTSQVADACVIGGQRNTRLGLGV
jgi:hypothetical protein